VGLWKTVYASSGIRGLPYDAPNYLPVAARCFPDYALSLLKTS